MCVGSLTCLPSWVVADVGGPDVTGGPWRAWRGHDMYGAGALMCFGGPAVSWGHDVAGVLWHVWGGGSCHAWWPATGQKNIPIKLVRCCPSHPERKSVYFWIFSKWPWPPPPHLYFWMPSRNFLAAQSSSRRLVVCRSVCLSVIFLNKWPFEHQMVTKTYLKPTYLPTYLCDSFDSSDSSDSCDNSDSSDQKTCFFKQENFIFHKKTFFAKKLF